MSEQPLGILAGGGSLPKALIGAAKGAGRRCYVVAFKGQADRDLMDQARGDCRGDWYRLGAAGAVIRALKREGVRDIILAGSVHRPSLATLRPDAKGARILARIGFGARGDDSLLSLLAGELEAEGFKVVSAQSIAPDLLFPTGLLAGPPPDAVARSDIERGVAVAQRLGAVDVGQSVIVQQGLVLGVEAIEGTDALIARCGALARPGVGGVLVKCAKPAQDQRLDLPTIGPGTIAQVASHGLRGVAVSAGTALLLEAQATIDAANRQGVFLLGIENS